jgi:quercetin dioxygenase-like cupin family protein
MRTATEAREVGVDDGTVVRFDVHATTWTATGDMDTGRPVWEYLAPVKQGDVLIGVPARPSVFGFAWPPDYRAPTHFHDVDQIQLVTAGETWMGNRCLRPGQGVFTPAGRSYNFLTGPAGSTIIEFRAGASFQTAYKARDVGLLGRPVRRGGVVDTEAAMPAPTSIPGWTAPDHPGKPVFFDAETSPILPDSPGDTAALPPPVAAVVGFQHLLTPTSDAGFSLAGLTVKPGGAVPEHIQSVWRILYMLSGELVVEGASLRLGQGLYVPASAPLSFAAGGAGAHLVECRPATTWTTSWM